MISESLKQSLRRLSQAALDKGVICGLTHPFYRYPARFTPSFAKTAIQAFTEPGDIVLDPYMGGGTAVVEALSTGRSAVGCDINSLALFITRVKTRRLTQKDRDAILEWSEDIQAVIDYRCSREPLAHYFLDPRARNLNAPHVRTIKKAIAIGMREADALDSRAAREFVRCALLRTGQWALDCRTRRVAFAQFRDKLACLTDEMLRATEQFQVTVRAARSRPPVLLQGDACDLPHMRPFKGTDTRASLVVTSPPYPGVHILYHRWQINGRRETPAPYWIAGCQDSKGDAFYNFGDRKEKGLTKYFAKSLESLRGIRSVVKDGAYVVQLLALNDRRAYLRRYLRNMELAGFEEVKGRTRTFRNVPNRKWYATLKGETHSSRELLLVHRAV